MQVILIRETRPLSLPDRSALRRVIEFPLPEVGVLGHLTEYACPTLCRVRRRALLGNEIVSLRLGEHTSRVLVQLVDELCGCHRQRVSGEEPIPDHELTREGVFVVFKLRLPVPDSDLYALPDALGVEQDSWSRMTGTETTTFDEVVSP